MRNELLLLTTLVVVYATVLLWFVIFGKSGLKAFTVFATITANIEVLILIEAFGLEQTLGNVLFASSFLVTDILSEIYGKKEASDAVNIGILTSLTFIGISQLWFLFIPADTDFAFPHIKAIFSNTPRLMFSSLVVYAISQKFDVWAYHKWWSFTERHFGSREGFLWLRNNGSTLISQLINAILFNVVAFLGVYDFSTITSIVITSYLIYIVTSLADTPVVYLARWIQDRQFRSVIKNY